MTSCGVGSPGESLAFDADVGVTRLRTNVGWAFGADGAHVVLSLASFFVLARAIGRDEFGMYATVIAISTFAIPVFSFGAQQLLMLDMQTGGEFEQLWARSVAMVVAGGAVATVAGALVVRPLVQIDLPVVEFAVLFSSQVVFYALSEFALVGAQAHRQLSVATVVRVLGGSLRLVAVVAFWLAGGSTTAEWAWFALATWAIVALSSLLIVRRTFGASPLGVSPTLADLRRGIPFAVGAGSAFAVDAADRPMLLRISGEADAGLYGAGYRMVQSAILPISALVRATDADFFAAGVAGPERARALARRMSKFAAGYGLPVGVVLLIGAPVVPLLLGPEWGDTADVVRWLAFLPLVKALQIFAANALTGLGLQSLRNRALQVALAVNVLLNLLLLPTYGWRGAAASTFVAEVLMAAMMWRAVSRNRARTQYSELRRS